MEDSHTALLRDYENEDVRDENSSSEEERGQRGDSSQQHGHTLFSRFFVSRQGITEGFHEILSRWKRRISLQRGYTLAITIVVLGSLLGGVLN
jgi:hypothetical protein